MSRHIPKNENPQATIFHKCREMIKLLNIHLNHFPKHEKYALCNEIRNAAYDVYSLLVECKKRYHNKTSLTKLDVRHEQLRMLVNLAYELGYYEFHNSASTRSESEANRRYSAICVYINELGAMIGGWIRNLKSEINLGVVDQ
ncbi:four helix bundle protein [Chrysiogenes arsenatis]|uniref:four helix bundle protein n=1 Tax=Chrysiogenes arsenatis TaxID=309797 RepID=UPI00048148C0|nr:four helix bundle protein [Chrysiogenes arsenatis]